jgi:two-component system probable response regulator PhcQ
LNEESGLQQVSVTSSGEPALVAADTQAIKRIMHRLMAPMSGWAAPGSTLRVNIQKSDAAESQGVAIHFETRNCEAAKAMQDCILFAPALQVSPKRASDYLKACLAIGDIGGTISSPPMENGYKQIHVTLPSRSGDRKLPPVPSQWLQSLSDEYEKWVLGTLEVAL